MRRRKLVKPKLSTMVPADWSQEIRRGSRANVHRWGLHALVLVTALGVPYLRGHFRARSIQRNYADAAACLYGGTPSSVRAVGAVDDPAGYYAAMFLTRGADWPSRCESALETLAQSPGSLLFPSVKAAEADVQKAAQITLAEIKGVPPVQDLGVRVPVKPLWGLELLRGAVAADVSAAGVESSEKLAPIAFRAAQPSAPTPTLLNIDAAADATLKLWGTDEQLQVAAFDRRGVSYMRLMPTDTTRARLPRPGSLHTAVKQKDDAYLVWTTAADKCGTLHCAGKSVGLAPMPVPLTKIPEPRWVAAHPFGSPSRSLAWRGERIWMAAADLDGTAKLLEFEYDASTSQTAEARAILPDTTLVEGARDLVVFAGSAGDLGALGLQVENGRLSLVSYDEALGRQPLAALPRQWSSGWLRICSTSSADGLDAHDAHDAHEAHDAHDAHEAHDAHYFVAGTSSQALVGRVRAGVVRTWPLLNVSIPKPLRTDNDPNVALTCADDSGLTLALIQPNERLSALTCERRADTCVLSPLADSATAVDVALTSRGALVAYTSDPSEPQLRLQRVDGQGRTTGDAIVPGPCWERWGGMCGAPTFTSAGQRLVLAARSGSDLMALQSLDEGETWSKLGSTVVVQPPGPHVVPRLDY